MFITYRVRKENYTTLKDTAFHLNNYITFKLNSTSYSSRFYDTFQEILLNHLFNFFALLCWRMFFGSPFLCPYWGKNLGKGQGSLSVPHICL